MFAIGQPRGLHGTAKEILEAERVRERAKSERLKEARLARQAEDAAEPQGSPRTTGKGPHR